MPFQVPPLIIYSYLGVTTATYSNLQEAWRSFWDSPVLPFLREWGDWLTRAILPFYEDPRDIYAGMVRARFDTGTIPALQEDTGPKVAMFSKAYELGTVSVNEYRAVLGLEGKPDDGADDIAALAEPEPPPEPPAPAQLTDLPPEMQAAAAAASEAAAQPEGKASPSVLTRHVQQYIEGEYAKARRLQLSSDDLDAAIAALDAALDDGLQLTAILAPTLRRDVARAFTAAGGTKAALPRTTAYAAERIIETLRKRAAGIAETTRTEIAAAMRAGLDLVTAGKDRASTRAETIVVTETATAENAGTLGGYQSRGVKSVRWTVGANPCADCKELDGNEYPIDDAPALPAHPFCGCSLAEVTA
jgi:SPP1 gp7 family putative phage head morphogenesis protein